MYIGTDGREYEDAEMDNMRRDHAEELAQEAAEKAKDAPRIIGTDGAHRLISLREDWAMYQRAVRIDATIYGNTGDVQLLFIPQHGKRVQVNLRREELRALLTATEAFMAEYEAEQARLRGEPDYIPF